MTTTNKQLQNWVEEVASLGNPQKIHWCNGTDKETEEITSLMLKCGDFLPTKP